MSSTGRKNDEGKLRMDLLPFESLEKVAEVLTYGAEKYADNNWKFVPDAVQRYEAALLRHLSAYKKGEQRDQESGLSHLAHLATNALFLLWFNGRETADVLTKEDVTMCEHPYVELSFYYANSIFCNKCKSYIKLPEDQKR